MRRMLTACIIVLSFSGCMVGPDYRRPAVEIPPAFRYAVEDAQETANTLWWKELQDPVLDALIAEALANNKDLKIAAANVEAAAAVLTQTRAPLFPQVSYSGDGFRERLSRQNATPVPATVPNPQTSYQVLADASWEIDLWGRIRRLSEAAQADLLATEEARRGVILSLVASVANSYIQLRSLDDQLKVCERTLGTYSESLRQFELQFKYGQVSQMNVEQSRSQYETAAAAIPPIKSQIAQTENALSILLGRNPGPIERGRSLFELTLPAVPAGLPSQLLERRPDLAQAEQNLIAANAQIGAAKALYFPTLSLTGALGTASSDLSDLFKGSARTWSYGGSVVGPIFTAGAISGQVKEAEATRKASLTAYESAIQSSFRDVENALVSHEQLCEQLKAQERLVKSLQDYDRLAWLLYNGGYTPYLDVLYAETQLFTAELNYVQTQASTLASLVTLYQAMGGGWVTEADRFTRAAQPPPAL